MIADRIFFLSAALASGLVAATATAQTIVPTPPFNAIELEGGGHVTLMHGSVQQVRLLKGSTQFTRFIVEGSQPHKLRIEKGSWLVATLTFPAKLHEIAVQA